MEDNLVSKQEYKLDFNGKGSDFFGIIIVNWLLTIITLGIYYPWAKAKQLQFIYSATSLNGDSFSFHGTGKEMFKGFIKAILIFGILYGVLFVFVYLKMPFWGFYYSISDLLLFFQLLFMVLTVIECLVLLGEEFVLGIEEIEKNLCYCFKWIGLTIITFGIYGAWMAINMRNYLLGNVRFGDSEFEYDGDGGDYFMLNLKGYLLTIVTLGIYSFWWQKDLFEYYVDNLSLKKGNERIRFTSTATGGDFFSLVVINILILIFTLGLGYAWIVTRTMKFVFNHVELDGNFNLDALMQTEENYKDATGEDLSDFLDLDAVM